MQKLKCPVSLFHNHRPSRSSAQVHYILIVVRCKSFEIETE